MEIGIGDTVRFLSEKLEGVVTGLASATTVNVYCEEHGFEIPARASDLVVIHPAARGGSATTGGAREASERVYLAFVPERPGAPAGGRHELYLVNDTSLTALYAVALLREGQHEGIAAGSCPPASYASAGNYSLAELDTVREARVQVLFHRQGDHPPRPVVDATVKVNAAGLCKEGAHERTPWFDTPAVLRPLDEGMEARVDPRQSSPPRHEGAKRSPAGTPSPCPRAIDDAVEVDLHAEQLLDTLAGMENRDILDHQLEIFHRALEEYKSRRGQKIVFIHGKGEGVLRQRIRRELQTRYKRHHHQDASFQQYGYGATMVTIR
ncbi:MAG: DUF2027 domain-containing protein [Odoribacteraceae bacterium]|jgi:hypothetical protein|nr:DUF2027 domain-containing protein [Odoribacteraceae bacterium]